MRYQQNVAASTDLVGGWASSSDRQPTNPSSNPAKIGFKSISVFEDARHDSTFHHFPMYSVNILGLGPSIALKGLFNGDNRCRFESPSSMEVDGTRKW
jgi:hypothetical protein